MGFEDEMDEWRDEMIEYEKIKPYLKLHNKNLVDCRNVSIWKVIWEYICWILAGRPKGHKIEIQKRK